MNKTNLIFLHKTIKAIADSIIKVFVPLLILKSSGSMALVILYLCLYNPLCVLLNLALKKFLQKYGVVAIILHFLPMIAVQFLLNAKITWLICIVLVVLMAFAQVLYSVPINILFSLTDKSVNVAKFEIPTNIGKMVFLLVSGYMLSSSFKSSLLILSIVGTALYIVSVIPIFYGYNLLKTAFDDRISIQSTIPENYKYYNIFHAQFGLYQTIFDVALPLYLYLNNLTFQSITIILVLIEICKIASNILAKLLVDRGKSLLSALISISIMSASFILLLFIKNNIVLYVCSCTLGVSFPLVFVPMLSAYTKKISHEDNQFDGMTIRDVFIFIPRGPVYLPYLFFPNFILQFGIGIACAGSMIFTTTKVLKQK